jgi:N-methylhydantoinase A
VAKTLSTPQDPSQGVFAAIAKLGIDPKAVGYFVLATTVATNLLLERKGAHVGLITTHGFRDVLHIQRIARPRSFDLHWVKPRHLVPRALSLEVGERVDVHGDVVTPLNEDDVRAAIDRLRDEGIEAISVCFLFSFANPHHERRTRELIHSLYPEAYVSISSDVFPQWREYERTSTTVIDAYLKPVIHRYVTALDRDVRERGIRQLLIMRSNGGVMTTATAAENPITMVRSGPAGGAVAAAAISELLGEKNLLTADMGGTSFDASLIVGGIPTSTTTEELEFGIPLATPMLDVRSIGAGGGSEAWIDSAGILKVGPQSAGANPGPVCYGRGGQTPTITDANVVLGRLDPAFPLGGEVQLDTDGARKAVSELGQRLGLDAEATAIGILEIANSSMAQTLRVLSIDKGLEPDHVALVAFGGAGPLHAAALAGQIGIRRVVIPVFPGTFSALGCLMADARFDYMQTCIVYSGRLDLERINKVYADLEERARADFAREGFTDAPSMLRSADVRYYGQNWELEVSMSDGRITETEVSDARRRFDAEHDRHFGWSFPDSAFEIINLRLAAIARRSPVVLQKISEASPPQPVKTGQVYFGETGGYISCPVYNRNDLGAGNELTGPAIITEDNATSLVPPGAHCRIDAYGNILMEVS